MPLEKGTSRETIKHNIEEMKEHGHSQAQAVAAALHTAHPQGGKDEFNSEKKEEAEKSGAIIGHDGVLNWAAGNHTMTPTESPSIYGDETIDPRSNSSPHITGVDSGEFGKDAERYHRRNVIKR